MTQTAEIQARPSDYSRDELEDIFASQFAEILVEQILDEEKNKNVDDNNNGSV
jgi:hypothetical protein